MTAAAERSIGLTQAADRSRGAGELVENTLFGLGDEPEPSPLLEVDVATAFAFASAFAAASDRNTAEKTDKDAFSTRMIDSVSTRIGKQQNSVIDQRGAI